MTALLVVLGGALGAPARYLIDRTVQRRTSGVFPWGTLTVNIVGSFILGAVLAASHHGLPKEMVMLLGTGLCGGFTTYSTLSFETVRLLEDGALRQAAGNALGSLGAGIAAATAGYALAIAVV